MDFKSTLTPVMFLLYYEIIALFYWNYYENSFFMAINTFNLFINFVAFSHMKKTALYKV